MMHCTNYRRSLLAEPRRAEPELLAHAATCSECSEFIERLSLFESRLERALRVNFARSGAANITGTDALATDAATIDAAAPDTADVPSAVVLPFAKPAGAKTSRWAPRRVWAVAASVLLGAALGAVLWLGAPGSSLAADVVGHMAEEPAAWTRTDEAVAASRLDRVLRASHVRLKPSAGLVSYANSCVFRGHTVPHLVVQTASGPVTVMVLPDESVWRTTRFAEQGYRGMLVPVPGHGSLAVLEKSPDSDMKAVEVVAAQVQSAIEWTG